MNELLKENRALGFGCATTAPPHFAARIVEIRAAIIAKRPIPAPSREFIAGAEKRGALRFASTLFNAGRPPLGRVRKTKAEERWELHMKTGVPYNALLDAEQRARAARLAKDITAPPPVLDEETRRELHRRVAPWESTC